MKNANEWICIPKVSVAIMKFISTLGRAGRKQFSRSSASSSSEASSFLITI